MWLSGEDSGTRKNNQMASFIRRYLFELYNSSCQICGWHEVNPVTNKVPLEIHHIDGDCSNNRPENLRWVDRKGQFQNKKTKDNIKKRADNSGKWIIKLSLNNEILHFYPSIREAARENKTSVTDIYNCCNHIRSRKTAKGFKWVYAE